MTFGLFFFDADLDGFEDLFMVNGHVVDETRLRHVPRAQPPQLFRNLGTGKFVEIVPPAGSGLDQLLVGRGAAYADYDGDGDLDILVSQNQGPALLLRNDTPRQAHYLRVHLRGTRSNRDGIGAEVRVQRGDQVLRQMVRTGRSYYSQNELPLTFGLGKATPWPAWRLSGHPAPSMSTRTCLGIRPCMREGALWAPSATQWRERPVKLAAADAVAGAIQNRCPALRRRLPLHQLRQHCQRLQPAERIWPTRTLASRPIRLSAMRKLCRPLRRRGRCSPLSRCPTATWPICTGARARPDQAAHMVRALAEVMPDAYFLDRLGSGYEESALLGLAMLLYREAARVDPPFPSARYNLGRLLLKQGQVEQGMAEVQEALRLYQSLPKPTRYSVWPTPSRGGCQRQWPMCSRRCYFHPDLATARNHLGRLYRAQGRLDEAIQTFRDLVTRHPEVAEARHNLAVAYAQKGLRELAIEQFTEALRLRPDLHAARLDLATLLLEMQRPHAALDALQPLLAAVSQDAEDSGSVAPAEVHYRLGIAYLQTRQFAQAWRHARQAEALGAPVAELIAALRRVAVEPQ